MKKLPYKKTASFSGPSEAVEMQDADRDGCMLP